MQTSVNKAGQPIAVAGQISDNNDVTDIVSRFSQETSASAVIGFGLGVKPGAARDGVRILTASTEIVTGLTVLSFNHSPGATGDLDQTLGGLKPNSGLQLMKGGRMYAQIDAGVTSIAPNVDRAYVRCVSNGGNTVIGALSNASDSTNSIDCRGQILFTSNIFTAPDGTKIAEVEVDFTNKP